MHGGFGGGGGGGGGHGGFGGHGGGGGHVSHHSGFGDSGHHHVHAPHGGGHDASQGGGSSFLQHALGMVHNGAGILGHLAQALTGHHAGLLGLFVFMLGWVGVVHFIHHNDPDQRSHPMDNATWRKQLTLGAPGIQDTQQLSALPESGAPMLGQEGAGSEGTGSMEAPEVPSASSGQDAALMAGMNSMLRQQESPGAAPQAHAPIARGSQRMFGSRTASTMPPQDGSQLGQQASAPVYQMPSMSSSEQTGFAGFGAPRELEAHEYAAAAPIGGSSFASGRTAFSAMAPPIQQPTYASAYGQPNVFGQPGTQAQNGAYSGAYGQTTSYASLPSRHARNAARSGFIPPPPPMTPSGLVPPPMTPSGLVPPPPPLAIGDAGAMAGMYNIPANSGGSNIGNGGSDYSSAPSGRRFARRVVTER
jgi:hypothetical protein